MSTFSSFDIRTMNDNVFALLSDRWMLVTAGTMDSWNTMTASWGGLGHLWNKDVAFAFVRPTRHTFGFMEREGLYTLSFFGPQWREALAICGKVSGRDSDKAALTGLKPMATATGAISFEQADFTLVCRTVHKQDIDPSGFIDPSIQNHYHDDYHRLYVGEILEGLRRAGA
jgi:flavin reductase (DIM6/NTAB) family NADH-FMN oxidoreductase RutF